MATNTVTNPFWPFKRSGKASEPSGPPGDFPTDFTSGEPVTQADLHYLVRTVKNLSDRINDVIYYGLRWPDSGTPAAIFESDTQTIALDKINITLDPKVLNLYDINRRHELTWSMVRHTNRMAPAGSTMSVYQSPATNNITSALVALNNASDRDGTLLVTPGSYTMSNSEEFQIKDTAYATGTTFARTLLAPKHAIIKGMGASSVWTSPDGTAVINMPLLTLNGTSVEARKITFDSMKIGPVFALKFKNFLSVRIKNCTFGTNAILSFENCRNVFVEDNEFEDSHMNIVGGGAVYKVIIKGNLFNSKSLTHISLTDGRDTIISNNIFHMMTPNAADGNPPHGVIHITPTDNSKVSNFSICNNTIKLIDRTANMVPPIHIRGNVQGALNGNIIWVDGTSALKYGVVFDRGNYTGKIAASGNHIQQVDVPFAETHGQSSYTGVSNNFVLEGNVTKYAASDFAANYLKFIGFATGENQSAISNMKVDVPANSTGKQLIVHISGFANPNYSATTAKVMLTLNGQDQQTAVMSTWGLSNIQGSLPHHIHQTIYLKANQDYNHLMNNTIGCRFVSGNISSMRMVIIGN